MKVCFVGLGSIGKRHCENLVALCREKKIPLEIHALRSHRGAASVPESIAAHFKKQVATIGELDAGYDAVFIANPTHLHYKTLCQLGDRSRYFFIEKPVFDRLDVDISALPFSKDTVCYVAAPLRYCGVLKTIRELLSFQQVYSARAICSSYLPDWRPGTDYRKVYSASKEAGGGVCIDLIHEWDYLSTLFGFPERVFRLSGTYSDLEINSEDLAVYIAQYEDKLVELHLDYFGRETRRSLELFTRERTIYGDIANARIAFSDGAPAIECGEERNAMYLREMEYFFSLILEQATESQNGIGHAMRVMALALGKREKQ